MGIVWEAEKHVHSINAEYKTSHINSCGFMGILRAHMGSMVCIGLLKSSCLYTYIACE